MNKNEKIQTPEEVREIENCKKAIEIYWRCYYEYSQVKSSDMTERDIKEKSANDADLLVRGIDMRYGAPGWGQAKLEYREPPQSDEKQFFVNAGGMDEDKFRKWQTYVGKEFEQNNLKFHYFL